MIEPRPSPEVRDRAIMHAFLDGPGTVAYVLLTELLALRTECDQLRAEREALQVQVTQWELTAVLEGLLTRGDIE